MVIADLKSIDYYGASSKNEAQELMLDPTGYNLKLSLTIGEKGKNGGDYFAVEVFNAQLVKSSKIVLASKSFIVCDDIDDIDDIEREIKYTVNSISGKDWNAVLNQLRYYFDWEYEDLKVVS